MSHVIMNGGESPLASKIKKGDASKAEQFAHTGSSQNDGGAAPTFGEAPPVHNAKSPTPSAVGLAKGSGIMRPRSKK
jgi:hypothetical protein